MPRQNYRDLTHQQLVSLLEARDRRTATRYGLVWETDGIEAEQALNGDYVALDLVPELCCGPPPWRNLVIEGDNFDALRALRPGFSGKVRCLATDPPYNTGNRDFLYNDRFIDKDDRSAVGSRAGDVFVTTWQTVATRVADQRNVRRESEQNDSIDVMIAKLRKQGLRIGVVVDEAHHSFHGETQAAKFFREVLAPEYTVLITATPDDADVSDFQNRLGGPVIQRTSIARQDAVDAGLIKDGVRCAAYFVDSDKAKMVDLEQVALRDAVAAHRKIKARLAADGVALTPLLLVQVDSTPKSTDKALERLLKLGFTKDQVAVHTAKEPDADILALAEDEAREVLVFKMSVALGFDAPRAFVLCSMRAARDEDFGVQLVGRILRVHRTLQAKAAKGKLPEDLRYGYVFLADPKSFPPTSRPRKRIAPSAS